MARGGPNILPARSAWWRGIGLGSWAPPQMRGLPLHHRLRRRSPSQQKLGRMIVRQLGCWRGISDPSAGQRAASGAKAGSLRSSARGLSIADQRIGAALLGDQEEAMARRSAAERGPRRPGDQQRRREQARRRSAPSRSPPAMPEQSGRTAISAAKRSDASDNGVPHRTARCRQRRGSAPPTRSAGRAGCRSPRASASSSSSALRVCRAGCRAPTLFDQRAAAAEAAAAHGIDEHPAERHQLGRRTAAPASARAAIPTAR